MELTGILSAILGGMASGAAVLTGILVIISFYRRKITRLIRDFVTPAAENQPSQLAVSVDTLSQIAAHRLIIQAKTHLMGMNSVDAKNDRALQGELALGLAKSQSPLLTALSSLVPSLGKRLIKNPDLLPFAAAILDKISGAKGGNGRHEEPAMKSPFGL